MRSRKVLSGKQLAGTAAAGLLGAVAFVLLDGLSSVTFLSTLWWLVAAGGTAALMASGLLALLLVGSVTGVSVNRSRLLTERRIKEILGSNAKTLSAVVETNTVLENLRDSVERMRDEALGDVRIDSVLARLEAAERRVMSSLETSTMDHHDSFGAIREQLETLQRQTNTTQLESQVTKSQKSIRSLVISTARDTVRQVEALLQLMPRVDTSTRRYPASSGYSMNPEGLLLLSDLIQKRRPHLIVEMGSGSSTIWGGTAAQGVDARYVAMEHEPEYFQKTQLLIDGFAMHPRVECRLAELRDVSTPRGTMRWYDPNAFSDLAGIDLLIVDGPPGWTGDLARYPALPVLSDRLADTCLIYVDDMHRADEQEVFRLWLEAFPDFEAVDSGVPRVALLQRR